MASILFAFEFRCFIFFFYCFFHRYLWHYRKIGRKIQSLVIGLFLRQKFPSLKNIQVHIRISLNIRIFILNFRRSYYNERFVIIIRISITQNILQILEFLYSVYIFHAKFSYELIQILPSPPLSSISNSMFSQACSSF